MTVAEVQPQQHSYPVRGVATYDLVEGEPATIVAFCREDPPFNQNPIMELRFFGPFANLGIWSQLDSIFNVLSTYQNFRSVMLVKQRMTLFIMEGLHDEDWVFLAEALSLSNQSWQLYKSRHTRLVTWQEWRANVAAPWDSYPAWRGFMMNPDSVMPMLGVGARSPPDGATMARGSGRGRGRGTGSPRSSSSASTVGRGRGRGGS